MSLLPKLGALFQRGEASAEDRERERQIRDARLMMVSRYAAGDRVGAQYHWSRMRQLIAQRSHAQIERMEKERGLR